MADLTTLEEKLAEVTGLAAAAADATKKVEGLLEDDQSEIAQALRTMREEAEETERRCEEVAGEREGKKTRPPRLLRPGHRAVHPLQRSRRLRPPFDVVVATDAVAAIYDELGEAALKMMERNMAADLAQAEDVDLG